jgi:hypothetical protein
MQHLHKAAGTTVVELAERNKETLWPGHQNGNPIDPARTILPVWEYGEDNLRQWVSRCEARGVSFVATEYGCPDFRLVSALPGVRSITVVRDPYSRLLSNFYFSVTNAFRDYSSLEEYHFSKSVPVETKIWERPNYYTRLFSRKLDLSQPLLARDYEAALHNLRAIHICLVLEEGDALELLTRALGWQMWAIRANSATSKWRAIRQLLQRADLPRRRRWGAAWRTLKLSREGSPKFRQRFMAANDYDLKLYEEARRLHGAWSSNT